MVRNVETDARTWVLTMPQNLSEGALAAIDHQIVQIMVNKPEKILVDLGAIQSIDSPSLNWLLAVQNRLMLQSVQLILQTPSKLMQNILFATRLEHRFQISQIELTPEHRDA